MGEDVGRLSDEDLDRIEREYVERREYPPAVDDVAALVAEVRALRAAAARDETTIHIEVPAEVDEHELQDSLASLTARIDQAQAAAASDFGRWCKPEWMRGGEGYELPYSLGWLSDDDDGVWSVEAEHVTAEDLEAAARIVRANQETP